MRGTDAENITLRAGPAGRALKFIKSRGVTLDALTRLWGCLLFALGSIAFAQAPADPTPQKIILAAASRSPEAIRRAVSVCDEAAARGDLMTVVAALKSDVIAVKIAAIHGAAKFRNSELAGFSFDLLNDSVWANAEQGSQNIFHRELFETGAIGFLARMTGRDLRTISLGNPTTRSELIADIRKKYPIGAAGVDIATHEMGGGAAKSVSSSKENAGGWVTVRGAEYSPLLVVILALGMVLASVWLRKRNSG